MKKSVKGIVEEILQPYLAKEGFELVDIEYVKEGANWYLRVFVDKEGGIDIDECGRISEYLSGKLDEIDPIPNPYFLEVSSPGAERPLKKVQDFYRAVGKNVYVTTYEPVNGLKEFEGKLVSFDEENLSIVSQNKEYVVPYRKVASARLAVLI